VSAILACDKAGDLRVNGMRIGGGQEIAWPATSRSRRTLRASGRRDPSTARRRSGRDRLPPVIAGAERAMAACVLCEPFSAHKGYWMGVLTDLVPALKVDGAFVANPLVETQAMVDAYGRFVFGERRPATR